MNIFLEEFSKINKDKKIVIVMDGAGWHQSKKLIIPTNIRIIILPPYSPELNPTEKLWQYIKDNTIKNRVYTTLRKLENAVCRFINMLTPEIIKSICNVKYVVL
jgi:transposase